MAGSDAAGLSSQRGMRTCTVVSLVESSTHQRSASACTMLRPRPETADLAASTRCGLVDPLPPSLTETTRSSSSRLQVTTRSLTGSGTA